MTTDLSGESSVFKVEAVQDYGYKEKYSKGRKIRSPALELFRTKNSKRFTYLTQKRQTLKKLSKNENTFFNSRFYSCPMNLGTCSSGELLI